MATVQFLLVDTTGLLFAWLEWHVQKVMSLSWVQVFEVFVDTCGMLSTQVITGLVADKCDVAFVMGEARH